jgi:N-acetylmuramoyl-L-alanine amidase
MKKAFLVPLLLVFLIGYSEAKKNISIKKLRYSTYQTHTRVVLDLDGSAEFTQNRLTKPDRIFFDLKNCTLLSKDKKVSVNNGTINSIRLAQYDSKTVRVVLAVNDIQKYTAFTLEEPNRLVIDIYNGKKKTAAKQKDTKSRGKVLADKSVYKIKRVVIDPGHGGKDPGAIGPRGTREKDIALHVGKKLGKLLKKNHGVEVIYTRDRDKFVPLNERTEIANSKKADLFISIHTNASKKRKVRGLETYFLSWSNDREAIRVAARENKVSIKKMQKMQGGLSMILKDLARNSKREESMRLAHSVQNAMIDSLKRDYSRIEDLGVKYALFYVLVGAEMPSILVEISFISNREEEKRLATNKYRDRVANAIAKGIDKYISQSTLIVNPEVQGVPSG